MFKDQGKFLLITILLILLTFSVDEVLILRGEVWSWSLFGLKGLSSSQTYYADQFLPVNNLYFLLLVCMLLHVFKRKVLVFNHNIYYTNISCITTRVVCVSLYRRYWFLAISVWTSGINFGPPAKVRGGWKSLGLWFSIFIQNLLSSVFLRERR